MKISQALRLGLACGALLASGGCLSRVKSSPGGDTASAASDRSLLAEATISEWSDVSALAARRTMEEYGVPDEVRHDRLIWNHNGPWRRTVVRDARPAFVEGDDLGIVEQTVDYALTPTQAVDVAAFDDQVAFNPRSLELTSRSDSEEHNFLRLNLANDVIVGALRPQAARDSFALIVSFEESGKTSPYLLGLRFTPAP